MKRIASFLLALAMVVGLVTGCGSEEKDDKDSLEKSDLLSGLEGALHPNGTTVETDEALQATQDQMKATTWPAQTEPQQEEPEDLNKIMYVGIMTDGYDDYDIYYLDSVGEVINVEYDAVDVYIFAENGLSPAEYRSREDREEDRRGLYGYIDQDGVFVIDPQYKNAGVFGKCGLAPVKDAQTGKWGYINENNETVLPFQYSFASPFYNNGYAYVEVEGKGDGVIDEEGKFCIAPQYASIVLNQEYVLASTTRLYSSFSTSFATGTILLDYKGNVIESCEGESYFLADYKRIIKCQVEEDMTTYYLRTGDTYTEIASQKEDMFQFGKCVVEEKQTVDSVHGKSYVLTIDGKTVGTASYGFEFVHLLSEDPEVMGYLSLTPEGSTEFCANVYRVSDGAVVLEEIPYLVVTYSEGFDGFPEGHIPIGSENGFGIIDVEGNIIVEPAYDMLIPYTYYEMFA